MTTMAELAREYRTDLDDLMALVDMYGSPHAELAPHIERLVRDVYENTDADGVYSDPAIPGLIEDAVKARRALVAVPKSDWNSARRRARGGAARAAVAKLAEVAHVEKPDAMLYVQHADERRPLSQALRQRLAGKLPPIDL